MRKTLHLRKLAPAQTLRLRKLCICENFASEQTLYLHIPHNFMPARNAYLTACVCGPAWRDMQDIVRWMVAQREAHTDLLHTRIHVCVGK